MSSLAIDEGVFALAKKQLRYVYSTPNAMLPAGYAQELKKHLEITPEDSNFTVDLQPGLGFGVVSCLEGGCKNQAIQMTKNEKLPDGGLKDGFGSLSAYRAHARSSTHRASRISRLKRIKSSTPTPGSSGSSSPAVDASKPKRLSLLTALDSGSHPLALARKRHSEGGPSGREETENVPGQTNSQAPVLKRSKTDGPEQRGVLSPRDSNVSMGFAALQAYKPAITEPHATSAPSTTIQPYGSVTQTLPAPSPTLPVKQKPDAYNLDPRQPAPIASSSKMQLTNETTHLNVANDPMRFVMDKLSYSNGDDMDVDDDSEDERFDAAGNFFGRGKDTFKGPTANPHDLQNFFLQAGNAEQFDGNASVAQALEKLRLPDLTASFCNMSIRLMPHQAIGVAWMLEKERTLKGGILADEMGLGKTVQMISTIMGNRSNDPAVKTTLIVAPLALLDQWKLEIELKTNNALSCLIYHGSSKTRQKKELQKHDIVLTTFNTLALEWPDPIAEEKKEKKRSRKKDDFIASDSDDDVKKKSKLKFKEKGLLLKFQWYRIVLDEAQNIRNKRTRISRAVTKLNSTYRWCLTGTPITNGLTDAYPLLRFLEVRPWYDWEEFNGHVAKHEKKYATLATRKLQAIFASCLLRRKKDSQLDGKNLIELPPKNVELIKLNLTAGEREVYNMVETRSQQIFNRYLRAGTVLKNYYHVLVMLLRLRQICSHTSLITEDDSEDLIITDEDGDRVCSKDELLHAQTILGNEFVAKLKQKLKDLALERMKAEKKSADATIENEECPICFDNLTEAVVTPCMHFFCRDCLKNVLATPFAGDVENALKPNERPCPSCRSPICEDRMFSRKAFEPTDEELELVAEGEGDKKPSVDSPVDKDEEMPDLFQVVGKGANKKKAKAAGATKSIKKKKDAKKRPKRAVVDSDEDEDDDVMDSDDSLDDFIVHSDEDEEMKDEQKKLKRLHKRKAANENSDYDEESEAEEDFFDDVIIGTSKGKGREEIDINKIRTLPKTLPSTKMMTMMDNILKWQEECPDDKVMVISQWTQCLALVSNYLNTKGVDHVKYQGDMNRDMRDKAVRAFMAGKKARVMLMSLKCGGVGLNLTRANRVISLDLGWSEAVENQAFDRVHRLGQEKPVFVQRLVIANSVEDRVLAMQERKKNLADGSLGEGSGKKIGRLSVRELANLFGLDADGRRLT